MENLQRYLPVFYGLRPGMKKSSKGRWVKFSDHVVALRSASDNTTKATICPYCGKDYPLTLLIGTYTELDTAAGTKFFRCGNCKRLYEGKQ